MSQVRKICSKCKIFKDLNKFYLDRRSKDGCTSSCKACQREMKRSWAQRNKEKSKDYAAKYRKLNPDKEKNYKLKKKYGISLLTYQELIKKQNKKCGICKRNTKLYVDHCHNTKNVRGLLCHKCNIAIGMFNDNKKIILNAINYLSESI